MRIALSVSVSKIFSKEIKETEELRVLTSCGCGVTALAVTPPGEFGDFPVYGKPSNRGPRPHFGSGRSA